MAEELKRNSYLTKMSDYLASLKLTIPLLLILAIVSIFGTIIPQNASPQEYLQVYKLSTYKILKILGLLDMYHAPWFFMLLALLSVNLIFCSGKRFKKTWNFLTARLPQDEVKWKELSPRSLFLGNGNVDQILIRIKESFSKFYPAPKIKETPSFFSFSTEKGRLSRLGVYFIHLSILIILSGALIGFYAGFRGNVHIQEGERINRIFLRGGEEIFLPGFSIQLEKFQVSFYPTGAPREFKSTLTVFEDGGKNFTASILVNQPLTYKGLTFYQASYGLAGVAKIILELRDLESGKIFSLSASPGKESSLPDNSLTLRLNHFFPDFQGWGPALQIILSDSRQLPENLWILLNHPEVRVVGQTRRYQVHLKEWVPIYYSGLQVTKDPGVEIVWVGCFLMVAGFYMTFLMAHRRIWARVIRKKEGFFLEIVPFTNRQRQDLEREISQIEQALLNMLRPQERENI